MLNTKCCYLCKKVKDLTEFYRRRRNKDGRDELCRSCAKEKSKIYRFLNRNTVLEKQRLIARRDKEKRRPYFDKWVRENQECLQEYRRKNSVKRKLELQKWEARNPGNRAYRKAKRRTAKLKATPPWVNKKDIRLIYEHCDIMKFHTGEEWHVDHIWPLQGKDFCGLHVPWNLQIKDALSNHQKKNKRPDAKPLAFVNLGET